MVIPGEADSSIDGAWNDNFKAMDKTDGQNRDFFGNPISNPPSVGASEALFDT
jgi:hypothetical protein